MNVAFNAGGSKTPPYTSLFNAEKWLLLVETVSFEHRKNFFICFSFTFSFVNKKAFLSSP